MNLEIIEAGISHCAQFCYFRLDAHGLIRAEELGEEFGK